MDWQRRSSGDNYASLSGHDFLIGTRTRRVIDCVIFSKKCAICESHTRKGKGLGAKLGSPDPEAEDVTTVAVIEDNTNDIMAAGVPNNDEELGVVITSAAPDEIFLLIPR